MLRIFDAESQLSKVKNDDLVITLVSYELHIVARWLLTG